MTTTTSTSTAGVRAAMFAWLRQLACLTGTAEVPGELGAATTPRIYPHGAPPETEFPYLVSRRADRVDGRTLTAEGDVRFATFELELCDNDAARLSRLAEALVRAAEGLDGIWADVAIRSRGVLGEIDSVDVIGDGSGEFWYVTVVTLRVAYKASPRRST